MMRFAGSTTFPSPESVSLHDIRRSSRAPGHAPRAAVADSAVDFSGSVTVRATCCVCTGERPSAGFCPACHFVADWVPVEYATAIVAIANHGHAMVDLLEACEQWQASLDARSAYGDAMYRQDPFSILTEAFRAETKRLDEKIAVARQRIAHAVIAVHVATASDG